LREKILLTGKYLNAIYETGTLLVQKDFNSNEAAGEESNDRVKFHNIAKTLIIPNAVEINFTTKEEVYKNIVENAYNYSSEVLLNLLLEEHQLINRLR
jgi:hypothetical protein